jgi:hypothetical protein
MATEHIWVCNEDADECESGCVHPGEHDAYCPACGRNYEGTRFHYDQPGTTVRIPFRADAGPDICVGESALDMENPPKAEPKVCSHNAIVENLLPDGTPNMTHAWKCADCGYVFH